MPFISVIIPLYNKEKDVEVTLKSVFDQTYMDFEVVVVNDGSTDNSLGVVEKFNDSRLNIFSISNKGVSNARNFGVKNSTGDYVAFLDADDFWYPNHLQNLAGLINKFRNGKWFATAYEIKHNNRLILPMNAPPMLNGRNWMGEIDNFFKNSLRDCMAWTSAVCMQRIFFYKLGGFDCKLQVDQDTDLWVRAALQSKLLFSTIITSCYNLTGNNHISEVNIKDRNIMDFDSYERANPFDNYLKKYLDSNRFSVANKFKIQADIEQFKVYYNAINLNNLSRRKRILLHLSPIMVLLLSKVKSYLEIFKIRIRTS